MITSPSLLKKIIGQAGIVEKRWGPAAVWTSENPVLHEGEVGIEVGQVSKHKLGDGVSRWTELPYTGLSPATRVLTSSATVTPLSTEDLVAITALAANLTIANPTGTPVDGQRLTIRIKDNGVARTIAYGSQYRPMGSALPATTIANKTLVLGFIYNATDAKWDLVAVAQEA